MTIHLTFLCVPGGDTTREPLLGDAPPSEDDLRMARAAAAALPVHRAAVRAPSVRCSQTADALGLVAAPEPALRDLDLGAWRGRTVGDIAAADPGGWTAWLTDPDAVPHGGEPVRGLCRRTADWLDGAARAPGDTVAVTEAAVVRAALVHALAVPARTFWHLPVSPLSAVSLTWRGGRWDVGFGSVVPWEGRRRLPARSATLVRPRRPARAAGSGRTPHGRSCSGVSNH
ncbi:histidine phosphatase family protein [Streptomyces bungoensis]|uniref:histidine phosphatase family protein n=1 Tax=Streptomyces bungoensis TaxID=285568 RepID=UPI0007C6EAB5|nr:histidine phosphatase family protein [Streptomyces bungoensis]